jgi:hypothetical protein
VFEFADLVGGTPLVHVFKACMEFHGLDKKFNISVRETGWQQRRFGLLALTTNDDIVDRLVGTPPTAHACVLDPLPPPPCVVLHMHRRMH